MNLDDLAGSSGDWLKGNGPESDIVISSGIRLARKLADLPFISRATDTERAESEKILHGRIEPLRAAGKAPADSLYRKVSKLPEVDRQFRVERQLISREHADSEGARAVVIDPAERF